MQTPWSVPDCALLAVEYIRLKRLYAAAVDRLFAIGYQVTDAEYQELKNFVEEARVQMDICELKIADHTLGIHARVHSRAG
jgi:hypothetical protein